MTRRILAGFLGVLGVVLVALVVPLGLIVTGQQDDDFRAAARNAARAVSAVAEEHLDDNTPITGLNTIVARFAADGDGVVVLDPSGRVIAHGGVPVGRAQRAAALAGRPIPGTHGAIVVSAPVGDAGNILGVAVLQRDRGRLDHRQAVLWAALVSAAAATLALGGGVAWSLSRWIGRPLTALSDAAQVIGRGDVTVRADSASGPPQVRELAGTFNDMAARVASLLEAQRGMTAEVSHQLRTPLAALRLRLELLAGDRDEFPAEEVAAMIDETTRLSRLVDGLLAVARAEAAPSAPEPADIAALAASRVDAWQPVAAERGIELRLAATDATALVTPGHVEQILDNLLDNAIEAVPSGGHVTVRVRASRGEVELTVVDDGPGLSAERREHAFDRFVTDRSGRGTGLGLAIVDRLVRADRGRIALAEAPGGGLSFTITLRST